MSARCETGSVLVVEDDEMSRRILVRRLEQDGCAVSDAGSGAAALALLESGDFDLVLLDIVMPGIDGYEVLARMKNHDQWRHIPVVMLSGVTELESVVRCIELGADDYLGKPFNPVLLRARVNNCLEKKRLRDAEVRSHAKLEASYLRLRDLERLRADLTEMVVHDLRTPLTSLISGLRTLGYIGELSRDQEECLLDSVHGGEELVDMIGDLLDISKMEDGSLLLELQPVLTADVVRDAAAQVERLAHDYSVELTWRCSSDVPRLCADPQKLKRALVNLLGNAIKFTPPGGRVSIDALECAAHRTILFKVCDTGRGIPEDSFEQIFEKFGQVRSTSNGSSSPRRSTGLGLTFCKMIVEAHGGAISVRSVVDEGSEFTLTVPLP